jgi:FkbM family methyltransferase
MMRSIYTALLRGPRFRGRARLEAFFRDRLAPSGDEVCGLKMQLDPQEWLQVDLLAGRSFEPLTTRLFKTVLGEGDTCIDVGAHVGFHTLMAARAVGGTGRVIAVDPQPYTCERLITNARLNALTNILVVCAAAGASDGFVVLPTQRPSDKARLSLVGPGVSDDRTSFEVALVRLDALAERHQISGVRLLKIDVEGYESEVLRGARALLERTENIILELLPDADPEAAVRVTVELDAMGFELRTVDGAAWQLGQSLPESNLWAHRGAPRRP